MPVKEVFAVTEGKGADLVIDCAGADDTFDQSIRMTKPGGKVLLVAFYRGPITADVTAGGGCGPSRCGQDPSPGAESHIMP